MVGGIGSIGGALIGGLLTEFLPIYAQQLLLPVSKDLANAAPGAVQGLLLLVVLGVARGGVAGLVGDAYRRIGGMKKEGVTDGEISKLAYRPARPD